MFGIAVVFIVKTTMNTDTEDNVIITILWPCVLSIVIFIIIGEVIRWI